MHNRLIYQTLFTAAVLAGSASQGWAGCLNPAATPEAISQFKANPSAMVAPSSDTRTIEAATRDLAGTDASLAADLIKVAQGTIPRFQTAIAAGLAQAALACSTVDQGAAQSIQEAVAGFEDGQFQAAFAAVAGDLSTAATAAATAYASSSAGSVVVVNPNTGRATTTLGGGGTLSPVQLSAPGAFSVPLVNTNGTSTTAGDQVSPVR